MTVTENGFLLDTNVLSEFNRRQPPNPNVKQWVSFTEPSLLYVSVITLSEIRFGIEILAKSNRRKVLERWLENELHVWFANGQILAIDEQIGTIWGQCKPLFNSRSI